MAVDTSYRTLTLTTLGTGSETFNAVVTPEPATTVIASGRFSRSAAARLPRARETPGTGLVYSYCPLQNPRLTAGHVRGRARNTAGRRPAWSV